MFRNPGVAIEPTLQAVDEIGSSRSDASIPETRFFVVASKQEFQVFAVVGRAEIREASFSLGDFMKLVERVAESRSSVLCIGGVDHDYPGQTTLWSSL